MSIELCLKTDVVTISPDQTIRRAALLLVEKRLGTLPVVDDKHRLVGLLTQADLINLVMPDFINLIDQIDFVRDFGALENAKPQVAMLDRPVSTVMSKPIAIERTGGLLRAYAELGRRDLLDLPVIDEQGVLVGLASQVDIGVTFLTRWLAQLDPADQST